MGDKLKKLFLRLEIRMRGHCAPFHWKFFFNSISVFRITFAAIVFDKENLYRVC